MENNRKNVVHFGLLAIIGMALSIVLFITAGKIFNLSPSVNRILGIILGITTIVFAVGCVLIALICGVASLISYVLEVFLSVFSMIDIYEEKTTDEDDEDEQAQNKQENENASSNK